MNIYLKLFLIFLKIGAVSFGGGVGMLSLIREECLSNNWLTEEELMNFIAVSESTPGPIAVNIATFIGSSQGGFFGAIAATTGVILPSFIIIILVATILKKLLKFKATKATLDGMRPTIVGLIIAMSVIMSLTLFLNLKTIKDHIKFDYKSLIIFVIILIIGLLFEKFKKKSASPIILILIAAVLGIIFYGFI